MARKIARGQSIVEAVVILAVFMTILLALETLFGDRAQSFDRAVLSRRIR